MSVSADYLAYVIDQFAPFAKLVTRRMFGAVGLYADSLFFGLISDDTLYLKVDDTNRNDYVSRGCAPFRPRANSPDAYSMSYFQVPEDVLEDPDVLRPWARKSLTVALVAAQASTLAATTKASKKPSAEARRSAAKAAAIRPRKSPKR